MLGQGSRLMLLPWLEGKAHLQDLPPLRSVLLGLLLGMHEPCKQPCYQGPGAMKRSTRCRLMDVELHPTLPPAW